jgi:hypothetical protein
MKSKQTVSWLCDTKEQADRQRRKLKTAGFSVIRPGGYKHCKIVVIGRSKQNDLFERVEACLNDGEQV